MFFILEKEYGTFHKKIEITLFIIIFKSNFNLQE